MSLDVFQVFKIYHVTNNISLKMEETKMEGTSEMNETKVEGTSRIYPSLS